MAKRTPERERYLADIITTAIEGGIGYWSVTLQYQWDGIPCVGKYDPEQPPTSASISPDDEDAIYRLTPDVIAKGIAAIRDETVRVSPRMRGWILTGYDTNDAGDIDADAADAIVQAALFNELVYG